MKWAGKAFYLQNAEEDIQLNLILGKPKAEMAKKAYEEAIEILESILIEHKLIEAREINSFAENFHQIIKRSGM